MAIRPTRLATLYGLITLVLLFASLVFLPKLLKIQSADVQLEQVTKMPEVFPLAKRLPATWVPPSLSFAQVKKNQLTTLSPFFGDRPTLIVNFWASWCTPCIDELPSLEYLNKQLEAHPDKSLPRLVSISVDETTQPIFQLFKTLEFSPSFLVLHDSQAAVAQSLGTSRFPETFWIDRKGKILHQWVGPQDWLSADVIELLARRPPS